MADNMFSDSGMTSEIMNDFLQSASDGFNFSLDNFGLDVTINDVPAKMLIKDKPIGTQKEISLKSNTIHIGDVIKFKNQTWLCIDIPMETNGYNIFEKATIMRCNTTFKIFHNKTRILTGKDKDGRPVYSETFDEIDAPCIASSTHFMRFVENGELPLPDGFIEVTLTYQTGDNLRVGKMFDIYDKRFQIDNIDYTKVIDGVGIIVIRGKMEAGGSKNVNV